MVVAIDTHGAGGHHIDRNVGHDFALELLQGVAGNARMAPGGRCRLRASGRRWGHRATARGRLRAAGAWAAAGRGRHGFGGFRMGIGGRDQAPGVPASRSTEKPPAAASPSGARAPSSSFAGREDALPLGGDVRTTMFGADYSRGRIITRVSLSHSRGLGTYAGNGAEGQVASAVTGLYPNRLPRGEQTCTMMTKEPADSTQDEGPGSLRHDRKAGRTRGV